MSMKNGTQVNIALILIFACMVIQAKTSLPVSFLILPLLIFAVYKLKKSDKNDH